MSSPVAQSSSASEAETFPISFRRSESAISWIEADNDNTTTPRTTHSLLTTERTAQSSSLANELDYYDRIGGTSSTTRPTAQPAKSSATATATTATATLPTTASKTSGRKRSTSSPLSTQPLSAPLSHSAGYFAQQSSASGSEPRSPANRRAPASRSSHGIETSTGPPPALSTQRSHPAENTWRNSQPSDQAAARPVPQRAQTTSNTDSVIQGAQNTVDAEPNFDIRKASSSARRNSVTVADKMTARTRPHSRQSTLEDDRDQTLRTLEGNYFPHSGTALAGNRKIGQGQEEENSHSSHEDLFLNLARTDSLIEDGAEPISRFERRRSRNGLPTPRQTSSSRQFSNGQSTSVGRSFTEQRDLSGLEQGLSHRSQRDRALGTEFSERTEYSGSKDRQYAVSAHPLDQRRRYRQPELTSNSKITQFDQSREESARESSPEMPVQSGRRQSVTESSPRIPTRAYRQSNLSYATNGQPNSSPFAGRSSPYPEQAPAPRTPHAEGTESTVSTSAPSTVWDELDDLKSRLRKLELTGKLPSTSGAAMVGAFNERPPTATTTVTTVSSSPKHARVTSNSPEASTVRGRGVTNIHPLLHSALAKAKTTVSVNVFRALEATASDALNLAATTGSTGPQGATNSPVSVVGTPNGADRQLRRKADCMCRSLTELCIALTENKADEIGSSTRVRPGSKDGDGYREEQRFLQASSQEPEVRASSRAMSRLEARRSSLQAFTPINRTDSSPQESMTPTQTASLPPISSRPNRNPSVVLRRRAEREREQEEEKKRTTRPSSRALTEAAEPLRPSPQTRSSREYTSQHPLPTATQQQQRSPSVQSSLPVRRSYFQATTPQEPSTPTVQPGSRRYLERSTPSSADSPRTAEIKQQRITSFGHYSSAGPQLVSNSARRFRQAEVE